jgi:hypothetical protein
MHELMEMQQAERHALERRQQEENQRDSVDALHKKQHSQAKMLTSHLKKINLDSAEVNGPVVLPRCQYHVLM